MVAIRSLPVNPSSLTYHDLPWVINHREDRCTLCGRCTSVCPTESIYLTYRRQRMPRMVLNASERGSSFRTFVGVRQRTDLAHRCIGCGMCAMVCPNEAIGPQPNANDERARFLNTLGAQTAAGAVPGRDHRLQQPGYLFYRNGRLYIIYNRAFI